MTAIDLRQRLGLGPRHISDAPVHFMVHTDSEPVSLVVDGEGDVVHVDCREAEPVPETVSQTVRALLTGAHQLAGSLLLVLDATRATSLTTDLREVTHAGSGH